MKSVLCYGDSLTWGYDPVSLGRHDYQNRWPSVLQKALGPEVTVIAEGLNGRTTAYDDYLADCERNGVKMLPSVLATHAPLDLVILFLGTNDLKRGPAGTAHAATRGMKRLVQLIRHHVWPMETDGPDILIVAPPVICETANEHFAAMFRDALEESAMVASLYSDLADDMDCSFFDASSVATCSPLDGIHLDAENTRAVGRGLEPVVRMISGV